MNIATKVKLKQKAAAWSKRYIDLFEYPDEASSELMLYDDNLTNYDDYFIFGLNSNQHKPIQDEYRKDLTFVYDYLSLYHTGITEKGYWLLSSYAYSPDRKMMLLAAAVCEMRKVNYKGGVSIVSYHWLKNLFGNKKLSIINANLAWSEQCLDEGHLMDMPFAFDPLTADEQNWLNFYKSYL